MSGIKFRIFPPDVKKRLGFTVVSNPLFKPEAEQPLLTNDSYDVQLDEYLPPQEIEPEEVNEFCVNYDQFPTEIEKRQVRCKGHENQQRLDVKAAHIKLTLLFQRAVDFKNVLRVSLKVHRINYVPNHINLFTGYAKLSEERTTFFQQEPGSTELVVYSDLDSVYEVDGRKVYELSKGNPAYNEFSVVIDVYFHKGLKSSFETKKFTVLGTKSVKRPRCDSEPEEGSTSPLVRPRQNAYFKDPNLSENFAKHQKIVANTIEAQHGKFETLDCTVIKSGNGDIAYHFKIKDQYSHDQFKPGEVIGFTKDSLGKVVIVKLTMDNAKETFLKGVVTKNQYLECKQPENNEMTATVCMLGLVPVNIIGPATPGEGLFASRDNPGIAISEASARESSNRDEYKAGLIGHAFQKIECGIDEINQVQGLVSIAGSSGQDLFDRQFRRRLSFQIKKTKRTTRRSVCLCSMLAVILFTLIAILLYQLYVPGSAYRRYICQRGSRGKARYWLWLEGKGYRGAEYTVIEVWKRAIDQNRFFKIDKVDEDAPHRSVNNTGIFHYYINIDSCAGIIVPGSRYMFAIDDNCTNIYGFDEIVGKWKMDRGVCALPRCNIRCSFKTKSSAKQCFIEKPCPRSRRRRCINPRNKLARS